MESNRQEKIMDHTADIHDLISLLSDSSEENAFEEGNTLNTMALFEISKPLQSTIIFESDNESSYSSNENDIEPKRQVKQTKQCSKKSKKTSSTGRNFIRVNEDDVLDKTENKYFQQCNENIVFDAHETVIVASSMKEATSTAELKNESCYPIVDTQTNIKSEFGLIDINTQVEEKNGCDISNAHKKIKLEPCTIKCEPTESHKYSLKNVEHEHYAKNLASFNEKNTSNSEDNEDNKIQNLIQEKNSLTINFAHDNNSLVCHITIPDNKKELVGSNANVNKNSNFVGGESNTIAADFGNNLKDIPTSINYTDKNIANPGHDSNEKNSSVNLLVKEILNIMYDVIKFDEYKKALGKENITFPYHISEENVIQEFKKFLISTLTKSWNSVVSQIFDKECITHSFVAYVLKKGQIIANDEGNSFSSHHFMGILKYFLRLNTIAKKRSKTSESDLHVTRPMANSQNTKFNESIALMNENSILNNGTTNHNGTHSYHTAVQTNHLNVLNNPLLNEMHSQERIAFNIDIDKNNVQSIKNVVMENNVAASDDTHAFNVNSPIAVVRIASNNLFAQPNTSLLSRTEKNVLPNASDKYQNISHAAPTYKQRFPNSPEHRQPPQYILPHRQALPYIPPHRQPPPDTQPYIQPPPNTQPYIQPPPNTRPYRQPPPYTLPYRQPLPYTQPYRQPQPYTQPYERPPNIPAQANDRQYQYENAYNPRTGIPGHVKENLFRFPSNYQTASQPDRNIVPNQSNYIPNNYVLHPDVSYRPRHPTSVQSSNSTHGATRNSQLRSELLKETHLHTSSKSLLINRTENPAYSNQPISQTQTTPAHATSQRYDLNSTNYNETTQYRPHHPTSVQYSNSTHGATHNSQLRSELLKKTHLNTCSKSLLINRTENPAYSNQPISQTQSIPAHATSQRYELNSTNYNETTQIFQPEMLTINPEQARSSTSRDSGFMSPSTSYEQTVSSPPYTASTTTISQSASSNAANIYTTTLMYPCIVCGKNTSRKCSRCMIMYLCSNICSVRDSSFHAYSCRTQ